MDDHILPTLPPAAIVDPGRFGIAYTAEQMLKYARDAVNAERERLALRAETRTDGWRSLTAEEIRKGGDDAYYSQGHPAPRFRYEG